LRPDVAAAVIFKECNDHEIEIEIDRIAGLLNMGR
jgi:hypothetical protein